MQNEQYKNPTLAVWVYVLEWVLLLFYWIIEKKYKLPDLVDL